MTIDKMNKIMMKDYLTTVTILENISDAIYILNMEGRIEYANSSALNLLRLESKEVLGHIFDEFLPKINKKNDTSNIQFIETLHEGIIDNIETSLIYNDYMVPVIINYSIINNDSNKTKYIIVTAKDISQWKNLEKELKEQQAITISHDKLKMIGELSVGLVHELTQPLLSLKMRTELLFEKIKSEKINNNDIESNFNQMVELIKRMEKSISNIRTYAHQTEQHSMTMVNIYDVIKEAQKVIEFELTENRIKIEIVKKKNLPKILSNRVMLEQVFVNLLKNSLESLESLSENKKIKKLILIELKSNKKKWVEIYIEDNGIGIDNEIINKIFDPFYSTKKFDYNSGLGLTIAKSVVASVGGDIKVEFSTKEKTRFLIRIPVSQKDEQSQLLNLIEMINQN